MDNDWVKVYGTNEEYKAMILKEKLAEVGIESNQVVKKGSEIEFFYGEVEIYVMQKDLAKASEILTKHNNL